MLSNKKLILRLKSDYIFESYWLLKIKNKLLRCGLQFITDYIFEDILKQSKKYKFNFLFFILEVLELIRPSIIFVKISKKIQKPLVLKKIEQYSLAIQWLFISLHQKTELFFSTKFLQELIDIVLKKKSPALIHKENIEISLYEHYIAWLE